MVVYIIVCQSWVRITVHLFRITKSLTSIHWLVHMMDGGWFINYQHHGRIGLDGCLFWCFSKWEPNHPIFTIYCNNPTILGFPYGLRNHQKVIVEPFLLVIVPYYESLLTVITHTKPPFVYSPCLQTHMTSPAGIAMRPRSSGADLLETL